MKGLLKKDLLLALSNWPVFLIIGIGVSGALIYYGAPIGTLCFFTMFFGMQFACLIFADRASGWSSYSVIFPISRVRLVRSRYYSSVLGGLAGFVLSLIIILIFRFDIDKDTWLINLYITAIWFFGTVACLIPFGSLFSKASQFLAILTSLLLPVLLTVVWSQSITSEAVMVDGIVTDMTVSLHLDMLMWMAAGCILLFILSFLFVPGFLSRRDVQD